jgi:hypothetical protein
VAAAGTNLLVQVGDRLPDAGVVGLEDGSAGRRITEPVEDRDALGRAQDHVEGWHGPLAVEAAEQLAGVGVAGWRPSNIRWNPATDASPWRPKVVAAAPCQRPGDSPWPDRYASWSVASSWVE